MQITVSAPGKVHLLGEHVVVYGRPALLAAIDKRLYVEVKSQKSKVKSQNGKEVIIKTAGGNKLIWQAIEVFKKAFGLGELPSCEITITSQIPVGCGLGSSAALSAATIGALMKFVKNLWNPTRINELTYEVEKIAHGNPSGADNTTVVFGGLVWYRKEFDFLSSIWSLPISSYKIPPFLMVDSGRPKETTKEMVARVSSLYKKKKKTLESIFHDQEREIKRLLLSLRNEDRRKLRAAIRLGEENLEKIGVVGNFAKKIIREIEKVGGAAKICGAGGKKGGSGILLCYHENLENVINVGEKYHVSVFPVKLGGEGIRIEKYDSSIKY